MFIVSPFLRPSVILSFEQREKLFRYNLRINALRLDSLSIFHFFDPPVLNFSINVK